MGSFLTDLVKPYVEKLINGAITESSYICCFTCIAKDFEAEKAKLEVERTTFNQLVDTATRGGEDVQANALFWEEQAVDLIQEDTKTKQKCFFGFCCNCIWRYRRGKELANKKEQIKKLIETRKELAIGFRAHLPDVERYSSQHYIPFKSRESKCRELLDALNDDNNYIVGLQGMGGTGKTTLAKEVGKKLKQSNQFIQVIDTTVSFSPDIKKIQDDIAGPLGLIFDDCNESDRPKKLWSRLTNGEKILLMLDDVWGDINFNEIGIPYSDNRKGCSVLVTTRNMLVCNRLGCSSTIQLDLLSEDDAWIMFQRHAGLSKVSAKNLLDRGHKIANECKRLPIAIAAIASSLKGEQRREKWDVALNSLQKHMSIGGVDDDLVDIYKCLKFSYDYLKNKNAEDLFLLCSVFEEDEEISTEILTRLGIGVGLFGERYDKYNNARNLVAVAKNRLLDSCLLLKTNKGKVKMHDLVREVAQWIANKEILVVDFSIKNKKSLVGRDNNIKYLSFHGNPMDLCSFRFDGSKLKILIFFMDGGSFVDFPVSFFEYIAGLRVLNLIAKRIRPQKLSFELPQSIRSLTNIRSLLVEGADLGDISILESLQSLETLDLESCIIDKLPEEIAKLKELRLLNLDGCTIESNNPFEVIQRCPSLEELYFLDSFNDFCQEITLPTLERYHIRDDFGRMNDSLSKCVSIEKDYFSEATYTYVMQTTELLRLETIEKGWTNIMPEIVPIDHGMNDLIELRLEYVSQLQCLVDTEHIGSQIPNVFSNLVVLELYEMNNLKVLCNGPISLDSMNNLKKLTVMFCRNLRSLFKGSPNLCNLKTVKILECPTLVSVFHLLPSGSLPMLEELNIINCKQLENIFTYERRVDDEAIEEILLPKLKIVTIYHCDKLTYIFNQQVKLDSLIELELRFVSNFVDIFPKCDNSIERSKPQTQLQLQVVEPIKSNTFSWSPICCYSSKSIKVPSVVSDDQPQACSISAQFSGSIEHFLALERLKVCESNVESILCLNEESERQIHLGLQSILLSNLPMMIYLFVGPKNAFTLKNLKSIVISRCEKLEIVFSSSVLRCLSQLSHLMIKECKELKHIIEDDDIENQRMSNFMPVLETLIVVKCNKLKRVFPISMSKELPKLELMIIAEADELEDIFKSLGGDDQKVEIPNLINVAFVNLPSLCHVQGIEFQAVENHFVQNCKKLSLTSLTSSRYSFRNMLPQISGIDYETYYVLFEQLEDMMASSQKKMNRTPEAEHEFIENVPDLEKLISEQSTSQQHLFGEIDTTIKLSQGDYLEDSRSTIPETKNVPPEHLVDLKQKSIQVTIEEGTASTSNANTITSSTHHLESEYGDGQIDISFPVSTTECLNIEDVNLGDSHETTQTNNQVSLNDDAFMQVSSTIQQQFPKDDEIIVSGLGMPSAGNSPTNSQKLMNEQSMHQQRLKNQERPLGEIDATIKPSQLEGSTSEKTEASTMPTISEPKNEPDGIKLITSSTHSKSVSSSPGLSTTSKSETSSLELMDQQSMGEVDTATKPSQGNDGIEIVVEEGTTSTCDKTITSSTHLEDGDGKISIPSFSTVNTKPPTTKCVDIVDSQEIIAMEDINKLIEEDPLLALVALEKLLTGQVSISSVRVLLQELKTLMDSSSDLDHLVSNQESISKLNSLFHRLNQHQGMLTSDLKDFVEKVQNFFNENIIKHATSQQVLEKHNQLLDSKTDLMNKLWSVKSTQTHIDSETSTTNAQIHELSLQIDELRKKLADLENQRDSLKSVANKYDVQKMKLKAECTELAQQSKIFFSALASSDVSVREAEHARNLAKEGFANLKSSFPRF